MSTWRDLLGDLRRLMLMEDKLARMETKLERTGEHIANHEARLIQIETLLFGPIPPDRLRLPRG